MIDHIWPKKLPQVPTKGFTEEVVNNILKTPDSDGVADMYYKGTRPNTLNLSFVLTGYEVSILETFIKNTVKGVKRFRFPHPRLIGTFIKCRFVPQEGGIILQLQYQTGDYWMASVTLEIVK